MEHMPYVDTLLREYLLFRGFTATLSTFNADKRNDRADRVDKVIDLIFRRQGWHSCPSDWLRTWIALLLSALLAVIN